MTDKEQILALELRVSRLSTALQLTDPSCIQLCKGCWKCKHKKNALHDMFDDTNVVGVLREVEALVEYMSCRCGFDTAAPSVQYNDCERCLVLEKLRAVLGEK